METRTGERLSAVPIDIRPQLRRHTAPTRHHNTLQGKPLGHEAKLACKRYNDAGGRNSRLGMRRENQESGTRAIRLEVDACHDAVPDQQRQDVVAMNALLARCVEL